MIYNIGGRNFLFVYSYTFVTRKHARNEESKVFDQIACSA